MTMIEMFEQFKTKSDKGAAVRATARKLYPRNAAAFMAGYRDSMKYADGLEQREATRTGLDAQAYSDGWTLAACIG